MPGRHLVEHLPRAHPAATLRLTRDGIGDGALRQQRREEPRVEASLLERRGDPAVDGRDEVGAQSPPGEHVDERHLVRLEARA